MTQTTPTATPLSRHAPTTDPGPAGSLYVGLHVPDPDPLTQTVTTPAQARYFTHRHLLAVGAGGHGLDLASTLLHPQVYRALTRGEQVIGIGHPPAEVSARLRLARALGRRAAVTCLPSDVARALPLLAEHPDVSVLMRGSVPDDLNLPEERFIHAWTDADLIEVLSSDPGDPGRPVRSSEALLQEWLEVRGRQAPPALVHIDVPGSRLAAGALTHSCVLARYARVQVVLHAMAWAQLTVQFGERHACTLFDHVGAVLMGRGQHQEVLNTWMRWNRRALADEFSLTEAAAAPFTALLTGRDVIEVLHLPPLHRSSFPVDGQGDRLATQPDVPPCLQPRSGVTPRT